MVASAAGNRGLHACMAPDGLLLAIRMLVMRCLLCTDCCCARGLLLALDPARASRRSLSATKKEKKNMCYLSTFGARNRFVVSAQPDQCSLSVLGCCWEEKDTRQTQLYGLCLQNTQSKYARM